MSLGKRIWDIARSNITDFRDAHKPDALDGLSEEERRALDEEMKDTVGAKAGRQARRVRDAADPASVGKYWLRVPKLRANLLATYRPTRQWMGSLGIRHDAVLCGAILVRPEQRCRGRLGNDRRGSEDESGGANHGA